ncbi:hypothetical protein HOP50_03g24720 [Chloropicon primus]|uniref:Uncharacterized protein n=1 Tax=Chloropicon primus TaxID=1764295 RepID=A0A5B8MIP9_9CHLO|nr:hypothetical protein A3770_03p24720 [Chloropicon primus]UPQ99165.1 hypothetical protein HOP50_03g24720 [Chloropicon primus]|mmetsp:Transcript_6480/g.19161  ORF Transcript_6480/g.19161 Transcript_6480/m.19161 type:complete len:123 (-) Transcript_6480:191-559(-)|eukprot:QDZ19954.1 hypothetical protein A3770_03p24720 [Chloropicon primus]
MLRNVLSKASGVRSAVGRPSFEQAVGLWAAGGQGHQHGAFCECGGCRGAQTRGLVNAQAAELQESLAQAPKKSDGQATPLVTEKSSSSTSQSEAEQMMSAGQPPKLEKKRKVGNSFRDLGCY